jgi:hypothetical protein
MSEKNFYIEHSTRALYMFLDQANHRYEPTTFRCKQPRDVVFQMRGGCCGLVPLQEARMDQGQDALERETSLGHHQCDDLEDLSREYPNNISRYLG